LVTGRKPEYVEVRKPEIREAPLGNNVVLQCNTNLDPPVKYSWIKKGGMIAPDAVGTDSVRAINTYNINRRLIDVKVTFLYAIIVKQRLLTLNKMLVINMLTLSQNTRSFSSIRIEEAVAINMAC